MVRRLGMFLFPLALLGFLDAGYLAFEHYQNAIPLCSTSPIFGDCGKVLKSDFSVLFGVPLALIGFIHYGILSVSIVFATLYKKPLARFIVVFLTVIGFISSLYFVYLQLFVIEAICFFCMISATTSTLLFIFAQIVFSKERKILITKKIGFIYKHFLKRVLFLINPEFVHTRMTRNGQVLGQIAPVRAVVAYAFQYKPPVLAQKIAGIAFDSPVGLAAGFDYEARLTQILPSLGFGFASVGTITNHPYEGNPRPLLGRLPESQSLMVNKGFKNLGAKKTITKLSSKSFAIPIGVSIGRTNSREMVTQMQSIEDIVQAFTLFEASKVKHAYYELNISCPNLFGTVSFYSPANLKALLNEIDSLKMKRPIFVKMPIEKTDQETLRMLHVIAQHSPKGVIFGNLQKDRKHPTLKRYEVNKFKVGNFSGKPTFERSNELIKLSYKHYKNRFVIIGTGGIFSADDAYKKITLGASLVQLITGMIYNGPQLIAEINFGLEERVKRDGFSNISEAIGSGSGYRKA